jgi:hypothetical protein
LAGEARRDAIYLSLSYLAHKVLELIEKPGKTTLSEGRRVMDITAYKVCGIENNSGVGGGLAPCSGGS